MLGLWGTVGERPGWRVKKSRIEESNLDFKETWDCGGCSPTYTAVCEQARERPRPSGGSAPAPEHPDVQHPDRCINHASALVYLSDRRRRAQGGGRQDSRLQITGSEQFNASSPHPPRFSPSNQWVARKPHHSSLLEFFLQPLRRFDLQSTVPSHVRHRLAQLGAISPHVLYRLHPKPRSLPATFAPSVPFRPLKESTNFLSWSGCQPRTNPFPAPRSEVLVSAASPPGLCLVSFEQGCADLLGTVVSMEHREHPSQSNPRLQEPSPALVASPNDRDSDSAAGRGEMFFFHRNKILRS